MDGGAQPPDEVMEDVAAAAALDQLPPSVAPVPGMESILATLSHSGRFIQYNIFGEIFEVTAKYKPPIMPIGKGAYGIVCSALSIYSQKQSSCARESPLSETRAEQCVLIATATSTSIQLTNWEIF